MRFSGRFSDFSLPDVLRILAQGEKAGALHISFQEREGWVFVASGAIYHAEMDDLSGEKAILYFLAMDPAAQFEFKQDQSSDKKSISTPLDELLQECIAYLGDWHRLLKEFPILSLHAMLVKTAVTAQNLSEAEQAIYDLISGQVYLYQLALGLDTPLLELGKQLFALQERGWVDIIGEEHINLRKFFIATANTIFESFASISGIKLKQEVLGQLEEKIQKNNWKIELQDGKIGGDKLRTISVSEQRELYSLYLNDLISLVLPIYGRGFIEENLDKISAVLGQPIEQWVKELNLKF